MGAPGRGGGQNHAYSASLANNKQAQLTNAYQELAKELGTDRLKVVGGYTLGRVIGEGTYGSVHLATHRLTGTRTAIKKIPKSFTPHLTREIHHHRRLHHPHIVHLHEILATETHIWLVTELCSGGELFDYLVERGRMLEGEARRLFGELTVAVGTMHRQGVVHRDLKLENVLLDGELRIKLGDLGFAREWQKGRLMDTFCGTTGYASPEMLACRKYLGVETDIWSLGIILYILLCGGLPFDDDDERVMKDLIRKGEYEEPDWLSEEARSLIRGMLQHDPTQRLTIEGILTHPWFKMTIVDQVQQGDSHSIPPSPNPASPPPGDEFFAEPFIRHHSSSSRLLSPHTTGPSPYSSAAPATVREESEASEASADNHDSEHSKSSSGATTPPTTTEEGDDAEVHLPRHNSAEFSVTEKALELLHPNNSQSTIRPFGQASPRSSVAGSSVKSRVAMKTPLEGQVEEDETVEEGEETDGHTSLPLIDDHLHLPVAQHSRTPSRTKRRSVSSTLSLERRLSHQSHHSIHAVSNQYTTYPPEDYLAKLNEERPPPFSTPSEKHLLTQVHDMGMDIGQLKHSVETDACDASAGMWWILRQKQAERGETDEVIVARQASEAKKREKAAAYAREERRKAREAEKAGRAEREAEKKAAGGEGGAAPGGVTFKEGATSIPVTPSFTVMDLGPPLPGANWKAVESPDVLSSLGGSPPGIEMVPLQDSAKPPPPPNVTIPETPPRVNPNPQRVSPEPSPARGEKEKGGIKSRSPSMSMLQRATSAWVGGKKEDKDRGERGEDSPSGSTGGSIAGGTPGAGGKDKDDKRSGSPTKLHKPPPKGKLPRSESDGLLSVSSARGSPVAVGSRLGTPEHSPGRTYAPLVNPSPLGMGGPGGSGGESPAQSGNAAASGSGVTLGLSELTSGSLSSDPGKPKGGKRDSIWNTFRHLFYEDRRRRKQETAAGAGSRSPLSSELKVPAAVVLSRGVNSRTHMHRTNVTPASRRASLDNGRPLYSRRSSSVNSRRSSMNSLQLQDHGEIISNLGRRASGRSHGSMTPTSDREHVDHPPSRPGSAHSLQRGGSRRSSMSIRSPSLQGADQPGRFKGAPPNSPLHNYRRRPPGGSDSSRVRHIKVIPESQVMRAASVASIASSTRSNASSRASSAEGRRDRDRGDSEYESGRDDVSMRSQRRQKKRSGSQRSLAQQIHRTRSPLAPGDPDAPAPTNSGAKKPPIRDVFQSKKGKGQPGDDEWVSEEEDEYAGGLGQGGKSSSTSTGRAGGPALGNAALGQLWINGNRSAAAAAAYPSAKMVIPGAVVPSARRREQRGRRGSHEEERERREDAKSGAGSGANSGAAGNGGAKGKGKAADMTSLGAELGGRGGRRALPGGRPAAPGIIEEEEEDEE
ncbi:hypothetical protein IAT38_007147 [Cryptococcus sp. DSM 104549]